MRFDFTAVDRHAKGAHPLPADRAGEDARQEFRVGAFIRAESQRTRRVPETIRVSFAGMPCRPPPSHGVISGVSAACGSCATPSMLRLPPVNAICARTALSASLPLTKHTVPPEMLTWSLPL